MHWRVCVQKETCLSRSFYLKHKRFKTDVILILRQYEINNRRRRTEEKRTQDHISHFSRKEVTETAKI